MSSNLNALSLAAAIFISSTNAAAAQSAVTAAIAGTIANFGRTPADGCIPPNWDAAPKRWAKFERDARPALDKYLTLASAGENPGHAFKQRPTRHWAIDGQEVKKFETIKDPWANQIARIDQVSIALADGTIFGQGVWKAYDKSGAILGIYDAKLVIASEGYRLVELNLWSPDNERRVVPRFESCPPEKD